jgi:hypothetical protein
MENNPQMTLITQIHKASADDADNADSQRQSADDADVTDSQGIWNGADDCVLALSFFS